VKRSSKIPTIVGAGIVFIVGFVLVAIAVGLAVGLVAVVLALIGSLLGISAETGAGLAVILIVPLYLAVFVLELYVMVRFIMTLPVIVLERQYNPLKALVRSWRLTRPRAWAILGFILLLLIAYFVIVMVLVIVLGAIGFAIGGEMSAGSVLAFSLVSSVIGAFVAMLLSAILVSMHQQLAGGEVAPELELDV